MWPGAATRSWVRCDDHGPTLEIAGCTRIFHEPVDDVWASDHFEDGPVSRPRACSPGARRRPRCIRRVARAEWSA